MAAIGLVTAGNLRKPLKDGRPVRELGPRTSKVRRALWHRGIRKILRQKLDPNPQQPQYILREAGVGYRLRTEPPQIQ